MKVSTDDLLKELGNPGKHQLFIFVLLVFAYFMVSFNNVIIAIHTSDVPFHCDTDESQVMNNASGELKQTCVVLGSNFLNGTANETKLCSTGWIYDTAETNIVTEWDLVCENEYLASLSSTIVFAGFMVGGLCAGYLSDRIGRKPIILLSLYGNVIIGVGLFFVPYYTLFTVLRFVQGFLTQMNITNEGDNFVEIRCALSQGLLSSSHAMAMELFLPSHRPVAAAVLSTCWGLGYVILSGIWYLIQDWRYIQLAITLPFVVTIAYIWLLPESLRWLLAKEKYASAEKVVMTISRFNRVPCPEHTLTRVQSQTPSLPDNELTRYTILDLFRTPVIRWRSLRLFFISFSANAVYFGLSLGATNLPGNKFLNFFISGVVELPAYLVAIFVLRRVGRRTIMAGFFILAGVACISSGFVEDEDPIRQAASVVLAMCGKFCAGGLFTMVFLFPAELYPTVIRNMGCGACAAFLNAGGLVTPQILRLRAVTFKQLPIAVFGGLALVAGAVTLTLPETANKRLPDKIEDVEGTNRTVREDISCATVSLEVDLKSVPAIKEQNTDFSSD